MPRYGPILCVSVILCALNAAAQPTASFTPTYNYSFSHFAGTTGGATYVDGVGNAARFSSPRSVAVDRNGYIYVGEESTVRRISPAGNVTTFLGKWRATGTFVGGPGVTRVNMVTGLAVDSAGNVYVAEETGCVIIKVTPAGAASDFVGNSAAPVVCGTVDGIGTAARVQNVSSLAIDNVDNLYFTQGNHVVRKITVSGVTATVSTIAGTVGLVGNVDGTGAAARFNIPQGIAVDSALNILVSDGNNQTIRKIAQPSLVVSTLAGTAGTSGSLDGTGAAARFNQPQGLTIDAADTLHVSERFNHTIRRVLPNGVVTTVAGAAGQVGSTDGTGSAARFNFPRGIANDRGGNLLLADTTNHTIRRITANGVVTTLAGRAIERAQVDGTGSAARFRFPRDIAAGPTGTLFVSEQSFNVIRSITPDGEVTLFAGSGAVGGQDGMGTAATFDQPIGVDTDADGYLYVADFNGRIIRKIDRFGGVTTLAGLYLTAGDTDGTGSSARFDSPHSLTVDSSGNVYVTEFNRHTIRKITPDGEVSTLAGQRGVCGSANGFGNAATFCNPRGIVVGPGGNLFVTDYSAHTVRQITPAGDVTTYAGLAFTAGNIDETGALARFTTPMSLTADLDGNLMVVQDDGAIRRILSGTVTTLVPPNPTDETVEGTMSAARIWNADGITYSPIGAFYINGRDEATVREMRIAMDDSATFSGSTVGSPTQLNTSPTLGTSWTWSIVRRPSGSIANLSSTTIQNPTVTPDIADTYTMLVKVQGSGMTKFSMVDVSATGACTQSLAPVTASIIGSSSFCASASGGTASVDTTTGGLELAYRWGYRTTSGLPNAITEIPGANGLSYVVRGSDLGGAGTRYLVVTVYPSCGAPQTSNEIPVTVQAAPNTTITAPSTVQGLSSGNTASIPDAGAGATYNWTISGGTINSGATTRNITFSARNSSPVTLNVTATASGCTRTSSKVIAVTELPYTYLHHAGTIGGPGSIDGVGNAARIRSPQGVVVDRDGTMFFTDTNHTVRRVSTSGRVSTLAGLAETTGNVLGTGNAARFTSPFGVTIDNAGMVYVMDATRIKRITPAGVVTTFTGTGVAGGADGGPGVGQFRANGALAIDSAGNIYVADQTAHTIRKVTPAGVITTIAGLFQTAGQANGPGGSARFNSPSGIAVDSSNNIYVADRTNHVIRKITQPALEVTTYAGTMGTSGSIDGPAESARFATPIGVAVDEAGNVFVAEQVGNRVRKITPAGQVSTLAGRISSTGANYTDGTGTAARFNSPTAIAIEPGGSVVVAESGNSAIRRVTAAGVVTTVAGAGPASGTVDATGAAALLNGPFGLAFASDGSVYFSDATAHVIRKVTPAGVVSTVAGVVGTSGSTNGVGTAARFNSPGGLTIDGAGNVWVADRNNHTIRKIDPLLNVTTVAGFPGSAGNVDAVGSVARFNGPSSIVLDATGNFLISDSSNHKIRKMTPSGAVTTLAGAGTQGSENGNGAAARFRFPSGIALDSLGNLYVADTNNSSIRKVTPSGDVTTVVTTATGGISLPNAVAVSVSDDVFFAAIGDGRVMKLPSVVPGPRSVGGVQSFLGAIDSTGSLARFRGINNMIIDANDVLYIAEGTNHSIRVGRPTPLPDVATGPSAVTTGSAASLDVVPQTATTYNWSIIRRPAGSAAAFSDPALRNPTFTPDMPDLYTLMVRAENVAGVRFSTINVSATGGCTPSLSAADSSFSGSASFCATATGGTAMANVIGGADVAFRWGWKSSPGGAITDIKGANSQSYVFRGADLGGSGTKYLVATVTPSCGAPMVTTPDIVLSVSAAPSATITTNATVNGFSTGNTASVPNAGGGAGYVWTVTNGTITGGPNSPTMTYTAGNDQTITIDVTVTAGGCTNIGSQVVSVTPAPYAWEKFAGTTGGTGSYDGSGTAARFYIANAVAIDPNGNLFVADGGNHVIRVVSRSGQVRTLAGLVGVCGGDDGTGSAARFCSPSAIALDATGNVFVAASGTIRRITPAGVVTTFAGSFQSYAYLDAVGTAARFANNIGGLVFDLAGNLVVADSASRTIRKITTGASVSTFAGLNGVSGAVDGVGSAARFNNPRNLAIDAAGTLYVSDQGNHLIRTITTGASVVTLAGTANAAGWVDGPSATARFSSPVGIAVDSSGGSVYVADNFRIRKISSGIVSTIAGGGYVPTVDGVGTAARLDPPQGLARDRNGDLYFSDSGQAIRKLTPAGVVTTLVGEIPNAGPADGTGTAALFYYPYGIARDSSGNLYVADYNNCTIRRITPAGLTSTFAGLAGICGIVNGTGTNARFYYPVSVAADPSGNLFVAEYYAHQIRKITPAGVVTTFAGGYFQSGSADGPGTTARFTNPWGINTDAAGNVYVAEWGNHTIRKITPAGEVSTLAGLAGSSGLVDGTGNEARFYNPVALVVDSTGDVLVSDFQNGRIRRVTQDGDVTTVVLTNPNGTAYGNLYGYGIAIDSSNNLFFSDFTPGQIKRITSAGVVTTIGSTTVGGINVSGSTDGSGSMARFYGPLGIAAAPDGETLYVGEYSRHGIRIGRLARLQDIATVSAPSVPAGTPVQLDTSSHDATSWTWSVIRQPAGSAATVSSASVNNPTFVPDMPDLYTFLVRAQGPLGIRYSTVDLNVTGACTPVLTGTPSASLTSGASTFCTVGTGGTVSVTPPTTGGLLSYRWGYRTVSLGAITDIPGATGPSYVLRGADMGGTGARFIVVTVVPGCGSPAVSNEIPVTVTGAPSVTITAPPLVAAKSTGFVASVPDAGAGSTYSWTISSGQITSGASTRQITFSSGNDTPLTLTATVTVGTCANTGSTTVTVSTLPYTFKVHAGTDGGRGYYDGPVGSARINAPLAMVRDRSGNTYFSDTTNTIRKISAAGIVSTVAGLNGAPCALIDGTRSAARFCFPEGLAFENSTGNLYVADTYQHAIRRITPDGVVTTIAGAAVAGSTNANGTSARFNQPLGITIDGSGTLFVADSSNHTIRQITPAFEVTTIAGSPGSQGSTDATGSAARFRSPYDITTDNVGNLYVADYVNNRIRKVVVSTGQVTTLAGSTAGYLNGTGAAARFNRPGAVIMDLSGNILVADSLNHVVRRVTPAGEVTLVAGQPQTYGTLDGPVATALMNNPWALAVDATGAILVAEYWNHDIRKIAGGNVSTFAGKFPAFGSADGTGTAATFNGAYGIAVDTAGNAYATDGYNNTIRKVTPAGVVTTFAGTPNSAGGYAEGTGAAAVFHEPRGIAVDLSGNVYVADRFNHAIRKITPAGVVSTLAGTGVAGFEDGATGVGRLNEPVGVTVDAAGVVYVTDYANGTIRRITPAGVMTTLAGTVGVWSFADSTGSGARFSGPHGIAVDSAGNVYVADAYNHRIRKITPDGATTTLAGITNGWVDGPRTSARFDTPTGVAVDPTGVVFVADRYNHRIRKVLQDGTVSTIGGQGPNGNAAGTSGIAMVGDPSEIAVDPNGLLYIADITNNTIHLGRVTNVVDSATVNNSSPVVGTTVTLDSTPQAGLTYSWSIIRRPAASGAELSSTSVRNPTFTPDIADIYTFLLRAESGANVHYSTIDVTATGACTPLSSASISMSGSASVCATGVAGTASAVTTGGAGLSYQWGYRTVSGSGPITDIAMANGPTYLISGSDLGGPGTKFLVLTVTPGCGTPITTAETTVTVQAALSSVSINMSGSATVTTTGTGGTATLSYSNGAPVTQQWGYRTVSGGATTNIGGQTAMTYVLNGAHFPGVGNYFLVATATPGCGIVTTSNEIAVTVGSVLATNIITTPNAAGTSIQITWSAAIGATSYEVLRRSVPGGPFDTRTTTSSLSFDDSASPNSSYLYRIRVVGGGESVNAYVGTFVFTDAPLTATTTIKAVHFMQLRTAANTMRALAGLPVYGFTDPTISAGMLIKRIHLIDLRQAVNEARTALAVTAIAYNEPTITVGVTTAKLIQMNELRSGVR